MTAGYVYIFSSDVYISQGKYKIGKSVDPKSRLRNMTTSCLGGKFILVVPCRNMDNVELFIHKDLTSKGKNIDKEWFSFKSENEAISYVKERVIRYDDDEGAYPQKSENIIKSNTQKQDSPNKLDKLVSERNKLKDKYNKSDAKWKEEETKLKSKIKNIQDQLNNKRNNYNERKIDMDKQISDLEKKIKDEQLLVAGKQVASILGFSKIINILNK